MTKTHKILLLCIVFACSYFGYAVWQLKQELYGAYHVDDKYAYGPADADLIVVDFNKYACDACREFHPVILEAVKRDGNVRYVPRIVTFGKIWFETLSAAVYAAGEQGKFIEMHNTLYDNWPVRDHKALFLHAKRIGLDVEKLTRDMSDPLIRERARDDQLYFEAWALGRTPALLVGEGKAIYLYDPAKGLPTVEEMLERFNEVR